MGRCCLEQLVVLLNELVLQLLCCSGAAVVPGSVLVGEQYQGVQRLTGYCARDWKYSTTLEVWRQCAMRDVCCCSLLEKSVARNKCFVGMTRKEPFPPSACPE
jgi:hypothetical protein